MTQTPENPQSFTDNYDRTTVVLVTDQFHCERLIAHGKDIATATRTALLVINITPKGYTNSAAIEHLYRVSKENGASMTVYYADEDIAGIMTGCLIENRACHVVTGIPQGENSVIHKVWRILPAVNFYTVTLDDRMDAVPLAARGIV